jgi:hypothetical protein
MVPPGLSKAALFRVAHDVERGAILHRAPRIEKLRLGEDLAADNLGRAAQADERGVADAAGEAVTDLHEKI